MRDGIDGYSYSFSSGDDKKLSGDGPWTSKGSNKFYEIDIVYNIKIRYEQVENKMNNEE